MSKEEDLLYNHLKTILGLDKGNSIRNWRPKALVNPKTGRCLELDIYIGHFPVGFEYQGGVHFRNIPRFKNNADDSRYNDSIKHNISLDKSRGHRMIIIEIFEGDLNYNIYDNVLQRITNTRDYYLKNRLYEKSFKIELLRLYYVNTLNVNNHKLSWERGIIWMKKPQTALILNYNNLRSLLALTFFSKAKGNKKNYFEKCLHDDTKEWIKPFIDDEYNIINNISFRY